MNAKDHAILGGGIAGATYLLYKMSKHEPVNLWEVLAVGIGGALLGMAPDLLEPATNPNHRSLFHSATTFALLIESNRKVLQSTQINEGQKALILSLSAAYVSHLVADGTTPKRIPLII